MKKKNKFLKSIDQDRVKKKIPKPIENKKLRGVRGLVDCGLWYAVHST